MKNLDPASECSQCWSEGKSAPCELLMLVANNGELGVLMASNGEIGVAYFRLSSRAS